MMYEKEREQVCEYAKRMWKAGFVVGSAGNVSMRTEDEDRWVITPSSILYEALTPDQVVVIDDDEDLVEGERAPSFETPIHLAVYEARKDVNAIIHSHSVYATALAVLQKPIPTVVDEMVVYIGGGVEVAKHGASGSDELANNVVEALAERAAALMANHGSLCVGKDLTSAFKICELVEHVAKVVVIATTMGEPHPLPDEVVAYEKEMYQIVKTM